MIPDGYELIDDEYVKKIPLLLSKEIGKHIEASIILFFKRIGYSIKKVPRMTTTRTVDYEYGDLGLEVTSIHKYLPRTNEMDQLSRNVETNSRICAYMYLKDETPKIEILDELQLDKNVSILCLRQHISCYRPKLISKIIDKYCQDEKHNSHIIILDFRFV